MRALQLLPHLTSRRTLDQYLRALPASRLALTELENVVDHQVAQEYHMCIVSAFRAYHIIEIMLHQIDRIKCPPLNLKLLKAHRYIGVPDLVRRDVILQAGDIKDRSALAFAGKYR